MVATVDFVTFADGGGANVVDQATWLALAARPTGFVNGLADPQLANKAWRQSSVMAAALAQYIANLTGQDVLDNGDVATIITNLTSAIQAGVSIPAARLVTSSAPLVILITDYAIGLNRTAALGAMTIALPPAPSGVGQQFLVQDLQGNLNQYPATVSVAGGTINGKASYVMDQDNQEAVFRFYAANVWGVGS